MVPWLADHPHAPFPSVEKALEDPRGLLAAGGDLNPQRLLNAYRHGIFPWYSVGEPILWWSPDPRAVFLNENYRVSRRLLNFIADKNWQIRCDTAFDKVIRECAEIKRQGQRSTWITLPMQNAYCQLHRLGYAHSIEVYAGEELIGGLYGVSVGQLFCGESMFSKQSGVSKFALAYLRCAMRDWGWPLLDGQVENPHLMQLGAELMPREIYIKKARYLSEKEDFIGSWESRFGHPVASEWAKSQRPQQE
jgi:leucyl/phenylalanyl-tRNA---protein transferase